MKFFKTKLILFILLFILIKGECQSDINLINPSFEGDLDVEKNEFPEGWIEVSDNTTPDYGPGEWQSKPIPEPIDGNSYLIMITREDGTSEKIGQKLSVPLIKGETYKVEITLSQSEYFLKQYLNPAILRIWGTSNDTLRFSNVNLDHFELLGESFPVNHSDWKTHVFLLQPKSEVATLILEAGWTTPEKPYRGHLLVDLISPIILIQGKKEIKEYEKVLNDRFEGGKQAFVDYFNSKIEFPRVALENCQIGVLQSNVKINQAGDSIQIEFLNSLDNTIEKVVSRVLLSTAGKWIERENQSEFELSIAFNTEENSSIQGDLIVTGFVYPKKQLCPTDEFYETLLKESFKNEDYKAAQGHVKEMLRRHPYSNKYKQMQKFLDSKNWE